jgi:uncharacterized Zn finger protein
MTPSCSGSSRSTCGAPPPTPDPEDDVAYDDDDGFPAYVSAAERRKLAARALARLRKQGKDPQPLCVATRELVTTFWGKAWAEHLASYADYASRLPRGRSYLRNGSVLDLRIAKGEVRALVSGSAVYEVTVAIEPLPAARWAAVRKRCAGQIATVVELLSGKLSGAVMEVLCDRERGLFPGHAEIELGCSCPDGARLCKHLAAVLYGVGARFDASPELLFTLRGVDGADLVADAGRAEGIAGARPRAKGSAKQLAGADLAGLFGIEIEGSTEAPGKRPKRIAPKRSSR